MDQRGALNQVYAENKQQSGAEVSILYFIAFKCQNSNNDCIIIGANGNWILRTRSFRFCLTERFYSFTMQKVNSKHGCSWNKDTAKIFGSFEVLN